MADKHNCGGEIIEVFELQVLICEKCRAFKGLYDDEPFPLGTNPEANSEAWDWRKRRSPER